jgi:hypothetical protein
MMGAQDAIEKLEEELVQANAAVEAQMAETSKARDRAYKAEQEVAEVREQFAELKERVANLGVQNAEMRGYIGRVQEDDVVREELIQTGDMAGGDVYLRPKRKHRQFLDIAGGMAGVEAQSIYASERSRRRHWVTY